MSSQLSYQERLRIGELRRVSLVLPIEVYCKLKYITQTEGSDRTELLTRLIIEEWHRQGEPIPE